ncbi:MAG: DNA polymerase III subunit delta [Rhizobiaceae bacterium]
MSVEGRLHWHDRDRIGGCDSASLTEARMLGRAMAQKRASEVDAWLARPDPAMSVILFYGPDQGLVAERAKVLAVRSGAALDDPFSVSRLDATELERQPGRLLDEVSAIPMFADRRLVWIRGAGPQKSLAEDISIVAKTRSSQTLVIVEAGDLRKTAPLRNAVESARSAIALPCYQDEMRSIDALIDEGLRGFTIETDARDAMKAVLGGDRLVIRSELEKLAVYAAGRSEISKADVESVLADVPAASVDAVIDAVFAGRADAFERAYSKAAATGQAQAVLLAACRAAQSLHLARAAMVERRLAASAALALVRPPLFGSRRTLAEGALSRYSTETLAAGLRRLNAAVLDSRRRPELTDAIGRQAILGFLLGGRR